MSRPYARMLPLPTSLVNFFDNIGEMSPIDACRIKRDPVGQLAKALAGNESNRLVAVPAPTKKEKRRHRALMTWEEEARVLQGLANQAAAGMAVTSLEVLATFSEAVGRTVAMSTVRRLLKRHGFRVVYQKHRPRRSRRTCTPPSASSSATQAPPLPH